MATMETMETLATEGTLATQGTSATRSSPQGPQGLHGPRSPQSPRPSPAIILPHGGYHKLLTYQKSDIIYQGTVLFTQRFLSRGDRTIDQMVQAARSGKQNIVEGSEASATLEEDFKNHGGIRERMHAARTATRGANWETALADWLGAAESADDLAQRVAEAAEAARRIEWREKRKKGWS